MREADYIRVTNLTKARIARFALADMLVPSSKNNATAWYHHKETVAQLDCLIVSLEKPKRLRRGKK